MNPDVAEFLQKNGFKSAPEFMDGILQFVDTLASDLEKQDFLSEEQKLGLGFLVVDVPFIIKRFRTLIYDLNQSDEFKSNHEVMLAKLMDDLISLGSVAMLGGQDTGIAQKVLEGARNGGARSAAARNVKKAEWETTATAEAIKLRSEYPEYTQDKLASEIGFNWKSESPPSHSSLKSLIRKLENDGTLPKASKKSQ